MELSSFVKENRRYKTATKTDFFLVDSSRPFTQGQVISSEAEVRKSDKLKMKEKTYLYILSKFFSVCIHALISFAFYLKVCFNV